jgi:hypothetical protein
MDFSNTEAAFECQICQGTIFTIFEIPTADDSIARCKACGTELGRWGDVKERAAKAAVQTALGDAINGSGFKFRVVDQMPARLIVEIDMRESL